MRWVLRCTTLIAAAAIVSLFLTETAAAAPAGTWLRATGTSQTGISGCGGALAGLIRKKEEPARVK